MKNKKIKNIVLQSENKNIKRTENVFSYYNTFPVWSFKIMDTEHAKWSLSSISNLYNIIIGKLKEYEGMTWGEIMSASGGKSSGNGNNNHFEEISSLNPEAQKRWKELKLEEYDSVFSLRLTGKQRLYGLLLKDGVFRIIWFDK